MSYQVLAEQQERETNMGILIDSDLNMIFRCDDCGDVVQDVDLAAYAVSSEGKGMLVHAGPCQKRWMDTHAGGAIYTLPVMIYRLAATYGEAWTRYSHWTPGQEE